VTKFKWGIVNGRMGFSVILELDDMKITIPMFVVAKLSVRNMEQCIVKDFNLVVYLGMDGYKIVQWEAN